MRNTYEVGRNTGVFVCKCCGKEFYVPDRDKWAYKYYERIKNCPTPSLACSYSCFREKTKNIRFKRNVLK